MIEIIETYWNVNRNTIGGYEVGKSEIIETYWNVNSLSNFQCLPHLTK